MMEQRWMMKPNMVVVGRWTEDGLNAEPCGWFKPTLFSSRPVIIDGKLDT